MIEKDYTTQAVHQGYIEPHAALASASEDGQVQVWSTTQGHFQVRGFCAKLLNIDTSQIRVTPTEIGGGFGGKTVVYLEPLAIKLSQKTGKPVKMTMTREEVFRASGPAPGGTVKVKIGAKKDGRIVAAECTVEMQAGAFPGSPVGPACMCAFACYDIDNIHIVGFDVVSNRPKVAAYRAPGAPISAWAVESTLDILALQLKMDPIDLRLKNAAKKGTKTAYGVTFNTIGLVETLEAVKNSEHYQTPPKPGYARGIAAGFWFNVGADSSAASHVGEDGSVTVISGNPDIGGSRASLALMAAEELGVDYDKVRPVIADTASIGFNFVTGGSRVTFATGLAVVNSVRDMIRELKVRAAKIWNVDPEGVIWENGMAKPAGSNVGEFEPLSLAQLAAQAGRTGGPINGHAQLNVTGAGPGFGVHCCDLSVDADTGIVTVGRYTAAQDVGTAIHPSYVEGQLQGGAVQGIGWALNEEYIYNAKGLLANPSFLDYRMPIALGPADDRDHPGRGPEPDASLRRARRRRSADRPAHRRRRQRDLARHRHPHDRPADVAAEALGGDRRGGAADGGGLTSLPSPWRTPPRGGALVLRGRRGLPARDGPFYIVQCCAVSAVASTTGTADPMKNAKIVRHTLETLPPLTARQRSATQGLGGQAGRRDRSQRHPSADGRAAQERRARPLLQSAQAADHGMFGCRCLRMARHPGSRR